MKKRVKNVILLIIFSLFLMVIIISLVSAEIYEWIKNTITGRATQQSISLNISVGVPEIQEIYNWSSLDAFVLGEHPIDITSAVFNFSVYTTAGASNLDPDTAQMNLSFSGETTRSNTTCYNTELSGDFANYTCNITVYWYDGGGDWTVTASIQDNSSNFAINDTVSMTIFSGTGFVLGPSAITWSGLSSGSTNQTSNNDPITLNNTFNTAIPAGDIRVNSTNLIGETDTSLAIWAGNFTVDWQTGGASCTGASCVECAGTTMVNFTQTNITTANLTKGNFTINDGSTGQEELYICITTVGAELTSQSYSTANESVWRIDI